MYQKFLPEGSIGIQVLSRNTLESIISMDNVLDLIKVHDHTLEVPNLDRAVVINHVLILD